MLQKLGVHIAACLKHAAAAERQAAITEDEFVRANLQAMAKSWRHLARSYQFVESLERFLIDADQRHNAPPPEDQPEPV